MTQAPRPNGCFWTVSHAPQKERLLNTDTQALPRLAYARFPPFTHAVRHAGWADGVRATAVCPGMVDTDMVADKAVPEGAFKIEPEAIAASVNYLLSLPNNASVAELLINSRFEASI